MTGELVKLYKQHLPCYLSSCMHLLLFIHTISFNEGKFRKCFLKIFKSKYSFLIQCRDQLGSGYSFQFAKSHHQVLDPLPYRCKDETHRCSQIKKKKS